MASLSNAVSGLRDGRRSPMPAPAGWRGLLRSRRTDESSRGSSGAPAPAPPSRTCSRGGCADPGSARTGPRGRPAGSAQKPDNLRHRRHLVAHFVLRPSSRMMVTLPGAPARCSWRLEKRWAERRGGRDGPARDSTEKARISVPALVTQGESPRRSVTGRPCLSCTRCSPGPCGWWSAAPPPVPRRLLREKKACQQQQRRGARVGESYAGSQIILAFGGQRSVEQAMPCGPGARSQYYDTTNTQPGYPSRSPVPVLALVHQHARSEALCARCP